MNDMGIHLITGYAGKEHITAADRGAYQAGIVGTGKYVLQSGNMFETEIVSNNLIKVKDGDLLDQGRHVHIAVNDYEECIIENGTQSMKRNDLVVVRYIRNTETGIETARMLVLKGTPGTTATDPEYITGDILNGDAADDFLMYRVKLDGLNIVEVEPLFYTIAPYKELVEKVHKLNMDLGKSTPQIAYADDEKAERRCHKLDWVSTLPPGVNYIALNSLTGITTLLGYAIGELSPRDIVCNITNGHGNALGLIPIGTSWYEEADDWRLYCYFNGTVPDYSKFRLLVEYVSYKEI